MEPLRILHLKTTRTLCPSSRTCLGRKGLPAEMTSTQSFQDFIALLRREFI